MKAIKISEATDACHSHIGGGAFIGTISPWPTLVTGEPLSLIASIRSEDLCNIGVNYEFISIFSYYNPDDYFLDQICYHGNDDELAEVMSGSTRVICHSKGELLFGGYEIPEKTILFDTLEIPFLQCSAVGENACFLQNEETHFPNMKFKMQLYSGDFPAPYRDIFGVTDAVGYLFLNEVKGEGLFFVQTT